MKYIEPELEIIYFESLDIITTSEDFEEGHDED